MNIQDLKLKIHCVPDCCTARVIHSFGGQGTREGFGGHARGGALSPNTVREELEWCKRNLYGITHMLVFLNWKQEDLFGEVLKECGFEMVRAARQVPDNEPNYLYVWSKHPVE